MRQGDGAGFVCVFSLKCINVHHVFVCIECIVHVVGVCVHPNTYEACVSSVTVGKLQAGSLGKCSPIHRNQWRI